MNIHQFQVSINTSKMRFWAIFGVVVLIFQMMSISYAHPPGGPPPGGPGGPPPDGNPPPGPPPDGNPPPGPPPDGNPPPGPPPSGPPPSNGTAPSSTTAAST
ncbi:histidine-rich glycoprotein-like isoform X1 [Chrysoperla carnea]|uniref:histidine-rich glycoprotein-like isoform X1 n=1 Tax=Chrysoperla carnea TaxID=189513 RepID=UPI001D07793B|nr:histidine-rich glycoprotein-like isoform X1 [Chrysoperla carnea]